MFLCEICKLFMCLITRHKGRNFPCIAQITLCYSKKLYLLYIKEKIRPHVFGERTFI